MLKKTITIILAVIFAGTLLSAKPATKKPAILFVSKHMRPSIGGTDLKRNMSRLDKLGYRVAYYPYRDLYKRNMSDLKKFNVIVVLDIDPVNSSNDKLKAETDHFYKALRQYVSQGGGVMFFASGHESRLRSMLSFTEPFGLRPMAGFFADDKPVVSSFGYVPYAYTSIIAKHPTTEGVSGFWYPVHPPKRRVTVDSAWRNANTIPFDVDSNWTVLASIAPTTHYKALSRSDGATDPFLQQTKLQKMKTTPAPIVAILENAEGKGRLAVCAINMAYTNFVSGNYCYAGIVTEDGLKGRPSSFNTLMMNVLDWLAVPSQQASRKTLSSSRKKTFSIKPYSYAKPLKRPRGLPVNSSSFDGLIGARSLYSGGKSSVAEYADTASKLGLDYLVFLEDFSKIKRADFEKLKKECEKYSNDKLVLIPGIKIQTDLDIWLFGFRKNLKLPAETHLKTGTRKLRHFKFNGKNVLPDGKYNWVRSNGHRFGMACGNFRLKDKAPSGVPASDYNFHNPFISIATYQNGKLMDSMMKTYLKCAGRTEWVSPITINFVDSAKELKKEWKSDHLKTVYLRKSGQGLKAFNKKIGDRFQYTPNSYVTNGPRIDEWLSSSADCGGGWWDWTRLCWTLRFTVSSPNGIKEVKIMDGEKLFRRFSGNGLKKFSKKLILTHHNMHNLILIITDNAGRKAISDEQWDKNFLLQLNWCMDRNNMLCYAGLPAPKSATGSTAGNYPAPANLEKGAFRESLTVSVNGDRGRLTHFDGQPMYVAKALAAPIVKSKEGTEGGIYRIARDIGRDMGSPDVAIQTAGAYNQYIPELTHPRPWTRGPLTPLTLFNAEMRYLTFSHIGHLPAPVLLEGKIRILKDISFKDGDEIDIRLLSLQLHGAWGGYEKAAIQHSSTKNYNGSIKGHGGTPMLRGTLDRYAYIYYYPSVFGSAGVISLSDGLSYAYRNGNAFIGFNLAGKTLKAGTELPYRLLVITSGFDEPATTRLPEALRNDLGMNPQHNIAYKIDVESGNIVSKEYILLINGEGKGFAGEIKLPDEFPVSLPVVVEKLNDNWTSVIYDRKSKKLRPLGMHDNKAYCHRSPAERSGKIFIGHPFTADISELRISAVQTGKNEITLQINNPTSKKISTSIKRSPFFDFVTNKDFTCKLKAGAVVEYKIKANMLKKQH